MHLDNIKEKQLQRNFIENKHVNRKLTLNDRYKTITGKLIYRDVTSARSCNKVGHLF